MQCVTVRCGAVRCGCVAVRYGAAVWRVLVVCIFDNQDAATTPPGRGGPSSAIQRHAAPPGVTFLAGYSCEFPDVWVQARGRAWGGARGGRLPWHRCLVTLTDGDQIVTVADILRTLDFIFQRRVRPGQAEAHRRRATTQINSARDPRPHPFFSWNGNDGNLQLHKKQRCQGATTLAPREYL